MKKTFLFMFLFVANAVLAQTQLTNFNDVLSALKAGKNVKVVIHYAKCKLYSEGQEQPSSPNAIGGMELNAYEYFDSSVFGGKRPSFIASSETVLISHKFYGYVYNYVKLRINQDGTAEIVAQYLKPRKFSSKFRVVMDETFKGQIDSGNGEGGLVFYGN